MKSMVLLVLSYTTFCACSSETHSCLKLTTSPPSYSGKLCPSEFNFYTFICDVNGEHVSWTFNGIDVTYFGRSNDPSREQSGSTDDYEYYTVLHLSKSLTDNNYAMRSSLTIYPHNNSLTQFEFDVTCSTRCGQKAIAESETYRLAEVPDMPTHLNSSDPIAQLFFMNKSGNCTKSGGFRYKPRIAIDWKPPENSERTAHSHYEYIWNNKTINTHRLFDIRSYHYDRDETNNFQVYAVDKCGRSGKRAHLVHNPEDKSAPKKMEEYSEEVEEPRSEETEEHEEL